MELQEKEEKLYSIFKELGSVVVAFSAGVDSTYLLAAAVRALGSEQVLAATSDTYSLAQKEKEEATELCRQLKVRHQFVQTDEFLQEEYLHNSPQRCFYCRDALFRALEKIAKENNLQAIVYGANADDLGDYRPGMKAAEMHAVRAPLLEAGL